MSDTWKLARLFYYYQAFLGCNSTAQRVFIHIQYNYYEGSNIYEYDVNQCVGCIHIYFFSSCISFVVQARYIKMSSKLNKHFVLLSFLSSFKSDTYNLPKHYYKYSHIFSIILYLYNSFIS